MSITPLSFTGISKFSNDFQTILNRSVSIASLPAKLLENEQKSILDKKMAVADLRSAVSDLASSLTQAGRLGSGGALTAISSSTTVVATAGSGAAPGSYVISDISSLAAPAVATSASGYANSSTAQVSSGDHKLQIVAGGVERTIDLTAATDNLEGVRDAINRLNLGVAASVIDTHQEPQRYFLSINATSPGEQTIELRRVADDPASNLLEVTNPGSNAKFKVNGRDVTVTSNSVSSVVTGVNLELKGLTAAGEAIHVAVSADRTPVSSALQAFVDAYNALSRKVDAQIGKNAGVLTGDPVVFNISDRLREVIGFQGPGAFRSLSDLGITLDSAGVMSFDSTAITWMGSAELQHAFEFLGDGATGLSSLALHLTALSDPVNGFMRSQLSSYDEADSRLTQQISDINARVNAMQATMMARLQAADTLLASLESQQNMLTATIDSLNLVTNGRKDQ